MIATTLVYFQVYRLISQQKNRQIICLHFISEAAIQNFSQRISIELC